MDKATIEKMKLFLEDQKIKLEEELKTFAASNPKASGDFNSTFPQYGDKEDENAAEVATFTDNLSVEKTLEGNLRDVKRALERIAKGTYGVCKYCGKEISEKRLMARPESGSCMDCKTKKLAEK